MIKRFLLTLLTLTGIAIVLFIVFLPSTPPLASDLPTSARVETGSANFAQRQGYNECGPYNVSLAVQALVDPAASTDDIVASVPLRFYKGYTLPQGVTSSLNANGLKTTTFSVSDLSEGLQANILKQSVANGEPVILLGKLYGVQHYVTVYGYDEGGFHVYDPAHTKASDGATVDTNGSAPGNVYWTNQELIDFWSGGGLFGLYEWFGIVIST